MVDRMELNEEHFNSHTREGVTLWGRCSDTGLRDFNSHTREGVTGRRLSPNIGRCNFNSHTREGVTDWTDILQTCNGISTHTPVRV